VWFHAEQRVSLVYAYSTDYEQIGVNGDFTQNPCRECNRDFSTTTIWLGGLHIVA